jgi:F-type H+-transporting ATPase subunit alpha
LTAELFDQIPLEQMAAAEQSVHLAAANIPADICARFESADKLSADDRKAVVEIARQALMPYQPRKGDTATPNAADPVPTK